MESGATDCLRSPALYVDACGTSSSPAAKAAIKAYSNPLTYLSHMLIIVTPWMQISNTALKVKSFFKIFFFKHRPQGEIFCLDLCPVLPSGFRVEL